MELPFISDPEAITNNDYHKGQQFKDFISSSRFKDLAVSPKYFRYKELNPEPDVPKPHFILGSVYHDMLAAIANTGDIDNYKKNWHIFEPPVNEKTRLPYGATSQAYLAAYNQANVEAGSRDLCSQDDVNTAMAMIGELIDKNSHLSKDIRFLLKVGKAEISHFCNYEGQGFKFRTDLKTGSKIVDWKSCPLGSAHPAEVDRTISKYNYHISAAFYQFFDFCITGQWRSFYWVFQEKEPPYDFIIESADNWAFEISKDDNGNQIALPKIGATMFLKMLDIYIECRDKNNYPGYSAYIKPGFRDQRIHSSTPPGWYRNQLLNFYE